MRTLSQNELTAVSGAGAANMGAQIDAIVKALAAKGITFSVNATAGTVTITTPKGSKTLKVPAQLLAHLTATPVATA
jgi:hypothetical protein